ncbi:uncharacterized protein F4812DRAFT_457190 [Daldinia caldariorum]|uniref:uncharacterized protein n=1 Tax=Daldinia caldariorum TaxID=326644 RepID=UPI002007616C|nr:uncharacterized protein F4812DRAFT_457190 [Daldinia caldariorum]KAI1469788.1 hypothetical protein F4812DRAFT_457190 [Daldinia caldariorum]
MQRAGAETSTFCRYSASHQSTGQATPLRQNELAHDKAKVVALCSELEAYSSTLEATMILLSGSSAASGSSLIEEEVIPMRTNQALKRSLRRSPLKSKKKRPSKKHIVLAHQASECESETSEDKEEIAPRKRAPVKKRKKRTVNVSASSSSEDSNTLVGSDADEESSESEESVFPKRGRAVTCTSIEQASAKQIAKNAVKPAPLPESDSDSTEEESNIDEEGSESEEEIRARDARKPVSSASKSDSSEDESAEESKGESEAEADASEESFDEDAAVVRKQAPTESDSDEGSSHSGASAAVTAEPTKVSENILMKNTEFATRASMRMVQIAQKLKRNKKEVQIRIQEISELAEENGSTINTLGKIFGDHIKDDIRKNKDPPKPQLKHPHHGRVAPAINGPSDKQPNGKGMEICKAGSTTKICSMIILSVLCFILFICALDLRRRHNQHPATRKPTPGRADRRAPHAIADLPGQEDPKALGF